MPMHPAAPEDVHGLVEAFAQTLQAVVDLGVTVPARDMEKPTECPGWSIKDQLSHIISWEAALLGRPDPDTDVPAYPYLTSPMGRSNEVGVELRRARPGTEVVQELQRVAQARIARLRDTDLTLTSLVDSPLGEREFGPLLRMRICDVWVHEQDIRAALARPGNLDSPAAATFVDFAMARLPHIVTDLACVEPGRVVMLELTGPVVARTGVRVERDEHGAVTGHLMFAGGADETGPIPVIGKTTSIQMSTEAFTRRAAGRRSVDDLRYSVHGDEAVARRVLEELVLTP